MLRGKGFLVRIANRPCKQTDKFYQYEAVFELQR